MSDVIGSRAAPPTAATPEIDLEELARMRRRRLERVAAWVLPALVMAAMLWGWDWMVRAYAIPHYILPGPGRVADTLVTEWPSLAASLMITLKTTFLALSLAILLGGGLAVLFSVSRWAELSFFPYAVILQVTPVIAIAPLIFIYVSDVNLGLFIIEEKLVGLLICAWLVTFFPILSNTTLGLNSADHNLRDLFRIYGASRWQTLWYLQMPAAMPYFLGGLRIAGGLALIGAIVAEFVAGTGGTGSGLAFRILEASYRLQVPKMFAALILIAVTGILIFAATSLISHLVLRRWHESAVRRDR
ncbi:MAG: ABC transporter permease [Pseudomonadota bacterium]